MRFLAVVCAIAALGASQSCASAPEPQSGPSAGEYLGARFAARFNSLGEAAEAFERAHAGAPNESSILKEAFFYAAASGDFEGAVNLAGKILATEPEQDDGLARMVLAAADVRGGKFDDARKRFQDGISSPFLKSIAKLVDASIERQSKGAAAALEVLKKPDPGAFAGLNSLEVAWLTDATGDPTTARSSFQESLTVGGVLAQRAYGAFLEREAPDDARIFYDFLVQQTGASRRVGEAGLDRIDRGVRPKDFTTISARQGAAAAFYVFAQAMIEQSAGERERAELAGFNVGAPRFNFPLVLARIAAWLDPGLDEASYLVGNILNIYGDYGAALAALEPIRPKSPLFAQARMQIAAALSAQERDHEGFRIVNDAIRRDPGSADLKLFLAGHYAETGDHARAVALYGKLIADLPDPPKGSDWRYFLSRGASLLELGDWPGAEQDLKRAVEIAPEEATALNYLGYSWAERGLNLDEAFKLINKAVELEPQSGAIVDSLGWAQYQLGRFTEAVVNLEKAASLAPADATVTDHLGDAYWRLGRQIEARYQWRRALELKPNAEQSIAIAGKLAGGLKPAEEKKAADGGA